MYFSQEAKKICREAPVAHRLKEGQTPLSQYLRLGEVFLRKEEHARQVIEHIGHKILILRRLTIGKIFFQKRLSMSVITLRKGYLCQVFANIPHASAISQFLIECQRLLKQAASYFIHT